MLNILFICTGNTCRSPMAEAMFRHMSSGDVEVRSAGIAAFDGQAASNHTQQVLKDRNIEQEHRAQRVTAELIGWADLILTMTYSHKMILLDQHKNSHGKVYTLKEYITEEIDLETDELLNWDIADPFGGTLNEYERTAQEIEETLRKLQLKLKNVEGNSTST